MKFKQHGSHTDKELFTKYECYLVQIFFKEKYTIKKTDSSTKIELILLSCYVMTIELARGGDKFYFSSFIHFEILFKKVSQG